LYCFLVAYLMCLVNCVKNPKRMNCSETIRAYSKKFSTRCGRSSRILGRAGYISKRHDIQQGEFPFMVQGRGTSGNFNVPKLFSGVLITDVHALVDIDCGDRPILNFGHVNDVYSKSCSTPGFPVKRIIETSDWRFQDDFVIAELERNPELLTITAPVCLPSPDYEYITTGPQSNCYQLGRGKNKFSVRGTTVDQENMPRYVQKMRVEETKCNQKWFSGKYRCFRDPTGQGAICHGDSGGPTVCQDGQTGRWFAIGLARYRPGDRCVPGEMYGSWRFDSEGLDGLLVQC